MYSVDLVGAWVSTEVKYDSSQVLVGLINSNLRRPRVSSAVITHKKFCICGGARATCVDGIL